jgi:hypothetical protein
MHDVRIDSRGLRFAAHAQTRLLINPFAHKPTQGVRAIDRLLGLVAFPDDDGGLR